MKLCRCPSFNTTTICPEPFLPLRLCAIPETADQVTSKPAIKATTNLRIAFSFFSAGYTAIAPTRDPIMYGIRSQAVP